MTDKKYDQLLRDFLEADAAQRAEGYTLASLHRAVKGIANDRLEDRQRMDRFGRRLRSLERENERRSEAEAGPDWKPDPRDVTGTHDLAVLRAQHEEMRDDAKWGRRQRWVVIGGIAAALIVATVSGCASYALTRIVAPTIGGK